MLGDVIDLSQLPLASERAVILLRSHHTLETLMLVVRSSFTKRTASVVVLLGVNVAPKRSAVAAFLGLTDLAKAKFAAAQGKRTKRVYVKVTAPLATFPKVA
jgi:hypothetical protein